MNRFDTESIVTRCLTYDDVNAVKAIVELNHVYSLTPSFSDER